jgi:hypothetical protein
MRRVERPGGSEPISPELVLVDPELAAHVRASSAEGAAPFALEAAARPRRGRGVRGLLASVAVLGVIGGLAAFVLPAGTPPAAAQYQYGGKVTICHHTHSQTNPFVTITVSQNAVPAHVRNHGDTLGPCP